MYKSVYIGFTSNAEKRAQLIADKANEMDRQGFELVNTISTPHGGAILTFNQVPEKTTVFTYKSIYTGFASNVEKRAQIIDQTANEMESQGYILVTVANTHHCGAILTFKTK